MLYKLYPNPSTGLITIDNPFSDNLMIEVYSTEGKKILQNMSHKSKMTFELETGLYFVNIVSTNSVKTFKVQVLAD